MPLEIRLVLVERSVLVLELHGDDGPAAIGQQRRELTPEPRQPARCRACELLIRAAQHQRWIGEEPGRVAAQLPLGAHVGTRPDDDVQPFGGGGAHERRDVVDCR